MTIVFVAVAALAVAVLIALMSNTAAGRAGSPFDKATQPRPVPRRRHEPTASLVSARRIIVNATAPRSLYLRVRPVLIELTEARLRERHGIGLDSQDAESVVGEPLWSIVRPGVPSPDHDDPALSTAEVALVIDRLEAL